MNGKWKVNKDGKNYKGNKRKKYGNLLSKLIKLLTLHKKNLNQLTPLESDY